jgi:NAD(P)-dependent dehydrogenase (short-subunit alcohol dehydrogenase family)
LLVNNASHFGDDSIQTLTPESWAQHVGPNLFAPILLSQAFAKAAEALPEDADPSIVNIIDQRVLRPNPQFFSYTLSKSALYTATQTLAQALAPRIRVNGVGPGPTLPSIHQSQATFDAEVAGVPLQRKTELSDITRAVLYLAGARSVTGQMIAVDNGQHLGWKTPDIIDG